MSAVTALFERSIVDIGSGKGSEAKPPSLWRVIVMRCL